MKSLRSILFVETMGGLGDLVLALPAIHALALSHPEASMHVLTLRPGDVLLEKDPLIDGVTSLAGQGTVEVRAAAEEAVKRIRPDLSVTTNRLHGLPDLLAAASGRAVTDLWRSPPPDELVDLRYLDLLVRDGAIDPMFAGQPAHVALDPCELTAGRDLLSALVPGLQPMVVLVPDSGMAVKRWPLEHWVRLTSMLRAAGRVPLLVTEEPQQRLALAAAGATVVPPLTLRQLAALFAVTAERQGLCVGSDTGPVRLAAAAGMQAVGLYGPTLGTRYGLRPDRSVNLQGFPECQVREPANFTEQVCWWDAQCPFTNDDTSACMGRINPGEVASALGIAS